MTTPVSIPFRLMVWQTPGLLAGRTEVDVTHIVRMLDKQLPCEIHQYTDEGIAVEYGNLGFDFPKEHYLKIDSLKHALDAGDLPGDELIKLQRELSALVTKKLVTELNFNKESWTFSQVEAPRLRPDEVYIHPTQMLQECANVLAAAVPDDLRRDWTVKFHPTMPGVQFTNPRRSKAPSGVRDHFYQGDESNDYCVEHCACGKGGDTEEKVEFLSDSIDDDAAWEKHLDMINIPYQVTERGVKVDFLAAKGPIRERVSGAKTAVETPEQPNHINCVIVKYRTKPHFMRKPTVAVNLHFAFPDKDGYTNLRYEETILAPGLWEAETALTDINERLLRATHESGAEKAEDTSDLEKKRVELSARVEALDQELDKKIDAAVEKIKQGQPIRVTGRLKDISPDRRIEEHDRVLASFACENKLHLEPRPEFQLWCLREVLLLLSQEKYNSLVAGIKAILPYSLCKSAKRMPSIIVYPVAGQKAAQILLDTIYQHFGPYGTEEKECNIGMGITPRFNHRITGNDLVYWAAGDGSTKNKLFEKQRIHLVFEEGRDSAVPPGDTLAGQMGVLVEDAQDHTGYYQSVRDHGFAPHGLPRESYRAPRKSRRKSRTRKTSRKTSRKKSRTRKTSRKKSRTRGRSQTPKKPLIRSRSRRRN